MRWTWAPSTWAAGGPGDRNLDSVPAVRRTCMGKRAMGHHRGVWGSGEPQGDRLTWSSLNGHISSAHSLLHKHNPGRVLWLCSPAPPRRPEQQREDSQPRGWEKTLVTSYELEMKRSSKREPAPKLNPGELSTAVHPRGYKERKMDQAVLVHSRLVLNSGCKPNLVLGPAGWMDSSFRSSAGDRGLVITPDSRP